MTSTIKVNNVQNQCGANIINENSNTITIGASGDTIALASGASQSGFGRTGTVDWQTGSIKTGDFTAASGEGYFVNTTSGAITVTLPASPSAGDIVAIADYAGTAGSNQINVGRNGSKIEGNTENAVMNINRESKTLVFVDATQGWVPVNDNADPISNAKFVAATGGTVTTCGNFKIHTFTGPGTLSVSCVGNALGSNTIDYTAGPGPLTAPVSALPVTATGYPVTVGGGGAASGSTSPEGPNGNPGNNSVFAGSSTITSAGGGGGSSRASPGGSSVPGGSGGGGAASISGGTGNTPPTNPPQGNTGGNGINTPTQGGGGGGGAGAVGTAGASIPAGVAGGAGGVGVTSCISGSPVAYAGGAGGGINGNCSVVGAASPCGTGGRGGRYHGAPAPLASTAGTTNRGGGGGGGGADGPANGGDAAGGSGIVIIRYKFQ